MSLSHGRQVAAVEDLEIEELLAKLTPEEIEELNNEMDPDNSLLPPSERCKNQTDKAPTGPFSRERLLKFLEDKAKNEKDWVENEPYVKKTRGKAFVPKVVDTKAFDNDMANLGFEVDLDMDIDQILGNASESELVDLAGILGFTGILTQEQITASVENSGQNFGGFNAITKHQKFKLVPDEQPNNTDVEEAIERLKANSSELKSLNLNNIKTISAEKFARLCSALKTNTVLETLSCANIQLSSSAAEPVLDVLRANRRLAVLNLESNFLTGDFLIRIFQALDECEESGLRELRLCNQRQRSLGVKTEQQITQLMLANKRLQRLGLDLETADARVRISRAIKDNLDQSTRMRRRDQSKERY